MNINQSTLKKYLTPVLIFFLCFATSCKKEEEGPDLEDGISTVVIDLAGDTNASISEGVDGKQKRGFYPFLFRFADKKQIWLRNAADSAKYLKSNDWDIAFTGPYNSEVFVNNGTDRFNPAFGGTGTARVIMQDVPYANVLTSPTDAEFDNSSVSKIGWALNSFDPGWYFYSLSTHIMTPIKNKTYLIRLSSGHYAKLELISVYQGNPPEVTNLHWPAPYLTFRYYVQNDGSKNLKTK